MLTTELIPMQNLFGAVLFFSELARMSFWTMITRTNKLVKFNDVYLLKTISSLNVTFGLWNSFRITDNILLIYLRLERRRITNSLKDTIQFLLEDGQMEMCRIRLVLWKPVFIQDLDQCVECMRIDEKKPTHRCTHNLSRVHARTHK